ncbi:MAG: hypothetical protein AB4368_22660 [Xenococcaceae cyanobacterium]
MAKNSNLSQFVAVSDLSKPANKQEGILVEVKGSGGDTAKNRAKALEIVQQMWEKEEIDANLFPDGITLENIFYVPAIETDPKSPSTDSNDRSISPIVEGAQEIIQLTKLQIEAQEAAEQAEPYVPIIQVILDRTRPLTKEEKELVKDKKYGKTLEKLGSVVATQEEFQASCSGNGVLILNAIAWQLDRGLKGDSQR